tara:strand:+ start:6457 stop:8181 length:1725 start_codon:yes stop_codon:yes gene_type:complete
MKIPAFLILCLLPCTAWSEEPAELIFTNGKVVTVDEAFSVAEAFAIRGDRIVAVGSNVGIQKWAGDQTRQTDLKGATVLPGLIDSHTHSTSAAMYEFAHSVPDFETIDDVLTYIATRAEKAEDGDWITMSQVFITRLRERRFPTRAELDEVAPKNPVYFRTGPDAAVNSMALSRSGIDRDFEVPEGSKARIERDPATGELTGIIRSAGGLIKVTHKKVAPSFEDRLAQLRKLIADYNRVGITGFSDRNTSDSGIRAYEALWRANQLNCRVYLYRGVGAGGSIESIQKRLDQTANHPLHAYNNQLWLRGVKIFLDGGMLTGSAYMREPWGLSSSYGIEDPEYRGMRYVDPGKLYEIAKYALERDLQFTAHAVGDGAVETLVNAYSRIAENDFPVREMRPCVTHCNFMSEDAIAKMAEHGIVADLQPAWLYLDGSTLAHHFGESRLTWFQPYRELFEKGVVVGGGSDHMQKIGSLRAVNPYNPFLGMWIALTRQPRWMDEPLHPRQRISREQAIRLYTINNAFLTFEEKEKGSLEVGKLADFIVLDRDILNCPMEEVRKIEVKETWLGGTRVHPMN